MTWNMQNGFWTYTSYVNLARYLYRNCKDIVQSNGELGELREMNPNFKEHGSKTSPEQQASDMGTKNSMHRIISQTLRRYWEMTDMDTIVYKRKLLKMVKKLSMKPSTRSFSYD